MEDFPSNSHISKSEAKSAEKNDERRVEKVVVNDVVRRKKGLAQRFIETFLGGDIRSVADYVILDVLIPAAKDAVSDALTEGIQRTIHGETRSSGRRRSHRPRSSVTHTNYNEVSRHRRGSRDEPRHLSRSARANHDIDNILMATRTEADTVLERMDDLVDKYGAASVADFYSLVNISPTFTDEKYGWMGLEDARVIRTSGGYTISLPRPEPLN